jgi:hypothetical protein
MGISIIIVNKKNRNICMYYFLFLFLILFIRITNKAMVEAAAINAKTIKPTKKPIPGPSKKVIFIIFSRLKNYNQLLNTLKYVK